VAVDAFLTGKIGFLDIASIVDTCLSKDLVGDLTTIEAVCAIDQTAREHARQIVASR
jgi:1-deoxy-D-xylulose 5-phosphate reductoisomerase